MISSTPTQASAVQNESASFATTQPPGGKKSIEVIDLKMHFPITKGVILQKTVGSIKAVDGVSIKLEEGRTLGLVGESGCGKTTTGRCILMLNRPTSGKILYNNQDLTTLSSAELRSIRQEIQVIFQDPYSSLNPRMMVGEIIGEGPRVHGLTQSKTENFDRVKELLSVCGLPVNLHSRYPHELSGGQRQRVGIARALSMNPSFIVCDEAVSALDVSIQAQVINLLEDLQEKYGLAYLFIAHDLSVVRHISDDIAVMYLGKVAEFSSSKALYKDPLHPYTQALLSAVPIPDPALEKGREHILLKGEVPSPLNPPSGCVFHPRCPMATEICKQEIPQYELKRPDHWVACHHVDKQA